MVDFIENPRRAPRMAIGCTVRIALRAGIFIATCTSDVGPGGCGVETPSKLAPGDRVFMELKSDSILGSHMLTGQVAWSSSAPPWRSGISFDLGSRRIAAALFAQLASAHPDAAAEGEFVDRIPVDAILAPTPVPGLLAVVPAEAEILGALGTGIEAGALRARLGERWDACVNVLFGLLGRHVVEMCPPTDGATTRW